MSKRTQLIEDRDQLLLTIKHLRIALEESVKLQSHYGQLLNIYDGGERLKFDDAEDWIMRLQQTGTIP